jgi:competence protein ComEC
MLRNFFTISRELFCQEESSLYEMSFLFVLLGILTYLANSLHADIAVLLIFTAILLYSFTKRFVAIYIVFVFFVGYGAMHWRISNLRPATAVAIDYSKTQYIIGTIEDISLNNGVSKVVMTNIWLPSTVSEGRPRKVRINIRDKNLKVGQRIGVYASLMQPKKPVLPGGFDFATYNYFRQIDAVGHALSKPKTYDDQKVNANNMNIYFNQLRHYIARRINETIPQPTSGMVVATLIGDASQIDSQVYAQMQTAGLLHLIAISGMHLTVVVGILFFSVRYILSFFPALCLYFDSKKAAALISVIGSAGYLAITGMPISAQRAFIMSSLLLLGILFNRKAQLQRMLVVAAVILLLLFPESVLQAGFQMSFMATLGLTYLFNTGLKFGQNWPVYVRYILTTCLATIIASALTAPYILYHFHQFSVYTVLANAIGVPIFDFLVMPLVMLVLLLIPVSLEFLPLKLLQLILSALLKYVEFINSLPNAKLVNYSISKDSLLLFTIGVILYFFLRSKLRLIGVIVAIASLLNIKKVTLPDVLVSENAKLFAVNFEGKLYFSDLTRAKFVRNFWRDYYSQQNTLKLADKKLPYCNKSRCELADRKLLITYHPLNSCPDNISLLLDLSDRPIFCNNIKTISKTDLESNGAHAFYWRGADWDIDSVS